MSRLSETQSAAGVIWSVSIASSFLARHASGPRRSAPCPEFGSAPRLCGTGVGVSGGPPGPRARTPGLQSRFIVSAIARSLGSSHLVSDPLVRRYPIVSRRASPRARRERMPHASRWQRDRAFPSSRGRWARCAAIDLLSRHLPRHRRHAAGLRVAGRWDDYARMALRGSTLREAPSPVSAIMVSVLLGWLIVEHVGTSRLCSRPGPSFR